MDHLILPGNYVTDLNSWQRQGVAVFPGFAVFREVGYVAIPKGADAAITSAPFIVPSPDLRGSDKPRLDRALVVPKGAIALGLGLAVFNRGHFASNPSGFAQQLVDRPQAGTAQVIGDGRTGIYRKAGAGGSYLKAATSLAATDANGRFADKIVFSSTELAIGAPTSTDEGRELVIPQTTVAVAGTKNLWRTAEVGQRVCERTLPYPYDAAAPLVIQSVASPVSLYVASAAAGTAAGAAIYAGADDPFQVVVLAELTYAVPDQGPRLDDVNLPYAVAAGQSRAY